MTELLVPTTVSDSPSSHGHSPLMTLDRTRIIGCVCGWKTPPAVSDSDTALASHIAQSVADAIADRAAAQLGPLIDDKRSPALGAAVSAPVGFVATPAERDLLGRMHASAPRDPAGGLTRGLVKRILAAGCTVESNECAIRGMCTNKCGALGSLAP